MSIGLNLVGWAIDVCAPSEKSSFTLTLSYFPLCVSFRALVTLSPSFAVFNFLHETILEGMKVAPAKNPAGVQPLDPGGGCTFMS